MFLNFTKKQTKSEVDPTLKARVNKGLYNQFTKLAEHYKCSNIELLRALIKYCLKRYQKP
ncbi:MAG: hypothetical protein CMK47_01095 [Prochlorococcus sp. MED105]|nr:hypothetical protein [Prochlorococcus sp. MED105]